MKSIQQIIVRLPLSCDIRLCSHEQLSTVIEHMEDKTFQGKFIYAESDIKFIAVDNSDGSAWTESFRSLRHAIAWLMGQFEKSDSSFKQYRATGTYFKNQAEVH